MFTTRYIAFYRDQACTQRLDHSLPMANYNGDQYNGRASRVE